MTKLARHSLRNLVTIFPEKEKLNKTLNFSIKSEKCVIIISPSVSSKHLEIFSEIRVMSTKLGFILKASYSSKDFNMLLAVLKHGQLLVSTLHTRTHTATATSWCKP